MKKTLLTASSLAAVAALGVAAPAAAQTNEIHYAGTTPTFDYTVTNPQDAPFPVNLIGFLIGEGGVAAQVGTRYTAEASAPADSELARQSISVEFDLSGTVNKDCSFYAGNTDSATTIDFGVIGIRTGDNENVNNAFSMVGDATADIETLTAGCNFNNRVIIAKDDVRGLVNSAPGAYDTDQFTANIPYSVTANWTGVDRGVRAAGTAQTLEVDVSTRRGVERQGAWRSAMDISIVAPAQPGIGIVAGEYEGTVTLTLEAI